MISFTIHCEPQAKGRPRFGQGRTYTPQKTKDFENLVALSALKAGLEKTTSPLQIKIIAIHKRPKRLMRKKDPKGRIIKDTKPDIDNIVKAVLDGLKGYFDDKQVHRLIASKQFCGINELPKIEVTISTH